MAWYVGRRDGDFSLWPGACGGGVARLGVYCGPVLRHPAELMLPAVDLGGRVWLGGKPCKGGPAAPAFGGTEMPGSIPAGGQDNTFGLGKLIAQRATSRRFV